MRELKDSFIVLELVLIGFQVIIWVSLLVLAVFGFQWIHLDALKQWSTEISVALVGVAYMFGLIFEQGGRQLALPLDSRRSAHSVGRFTQPFGDACGNPNSQPGSV